MRKWLPLLTVCLGTFMLLLDVTIVNVALPGMAGDLHTSFGSLQWVVDGYALALAALLLGVGTVADRVGHRRVYLTGLVVFALSSLCCGLAPGAGALVAGRCVQGAGAAAMFATTFALINGSYTGRDRAAAYGVWGSVSGVAAAAGPVAGGLLTQGLSWRWIFFVNLPVSVAAVALVVVVLRGVRTPTRAGRIDAGGMLLFTGTVGSATYGLIRANEAGWTAGSSWMPLAGSAVLLALFVVVETKVADPLLRLALVRDRTFGGVLLSALVANFAAFASLPYTSLWLQSVLGLGPVAAGLVGLPMPVATFLVSAFGGRLLHTWAPGRVIGGGLALMGAGDLVAFALTHGSPSWPALLPGFLVIGVGVGMVNPVMSSTGMAAAPAERAGMAAGAANTARQLGFAFGIALLGSVFSAGAGRALRGSGTAAPSATAHAMAGGQSPRLLASAPAPAREGLRTALRHAAAGGVHELYLVAGLAGLAAAFAVVLLVKPVPARPGGPAARTGAQPQAATPA